MRAENEYHRFGILAYLAAYDVHRARVFGPARAGGMMLAGFTRIIRVVVANSRDAIRMPDAVGPPAC